MCPASTEWERRAFRVAGQAIGAIFVGAPIDRVSVEEGTCVLWGKLSRPAPRPDDRILAGIFITLMGVGAQERYCVGVPPGDVVWLMPRADEPELLRDVEEADAASVALSGTTDGGLEAVWRYAGEMLGDDDVWKAVEAVAEELLKGQLDVRRLREFVVPDERLRTNEKTFVFCITGFGALAGLGAETCATE
jgi:hypothetical protein